MTRQKKGLTQERPRSLEAQTRTRQGKGSSILVTSLILKGVVVVVHGKDAVCHEEKDLRSHFLIEGFVGLDF